MLKTSVLAVLLGVVAAATPESGRGDDGFGYKYHWTAMDNDYFGFAINFDTDSGYRTLYAAEEKDNLHNEQYSLDIYSFINATVRVEFFKSYYTTYVFSFVPFNVKPYSQEMSAVRPESEEENMGSVFGGYEVTVAKLTTTVYQNSKTCHSSFIDILMGVTTWAPICDYNTEKEVTYIDDRLSYSPLEGETWANWHQLWHARLW